MSCVALDKTKDENKDYITLNYKPDYVEDKFNFTTRCSKDVFLSYQNSSPFLDDFSGDPDDVIYMDFGYAYTVAKSQGSEWNNVLVVDEFKGGDYLYNKWKYTGVSRSKVSVTLAYT
jgi:hypothetical protein